MLIKKLAVPLINEKILQHAEYCYFATAALTEAGFDFVKDRLPPNCKIELVTGLDALTSPDVLRRIWRHYQNRIAFHIYTRNVFHANVYIFDLPYRKSVAFVGSGTLSLGGVKDHDEVFYKITDPKEIEALKSWFTGYFEFAEPLSEDIMQAYELIYPPLKQREIASGKEIENFIALTAGSFNWDTLRLKNHYFKKEDYLAFSTLKAPYDTDDFRKERLVVQEKFITLHEAIRKQVAMLKFHAPTDALDILSSLTPDQHLHGMLKSMWITYGKARADHKIHSPGVCDMNFMGMQICIGQKDVIISLGGYQGQSKTDREFLKQNLVDVDFTARLLKVITSLPQGYWIEVAGDRKPVESFQKEAALALFLKDDDWRFYDFALGKMYLPEDAEISSEHIAATVMKVFDQLSQAYAVMRQP